MKARTLNTDEETAMVKYLSGTFPHMVSPRSELSIISSQIFVNPLHLTCYLEGKRCLGKEFYHGRVYGANGTYYFYTVRGIQNHEIISSMVLNPEEKELLKTSTSHRIFEGLVEGYKW